MCMPSGARSMPLDVSIRSRAFGRSGCGSFGGVGRSNTWGRVSGDWIFRAGWLRARAPNGLRVILLIFTPGHGGPGCCDDRLWDAPVLPTD